MKWDGYDTECGRGPPCSIVLWDREERQCQAGQAGAGRLWDDGGAKARDCMSRFTRRRRWRRQSPCQKKSGSSARRHLIHFFTGARRNLIQNNCYTLKKKSSTYNRTQLVLDRGHDQTCSAERAASRAEHVHRAVLVTLTVSH